MWYVLLDGINRQFFLNRIFNVFLFFVVKLNANRKVTGVLRGYDQFMNLVLENAMEEVSAENRIEIGTVVCVKINLKYIKYLNKKLGYQRKQCYYD